MSVSLTVVSQQKSLGDEERGSMASNIIDDSNILSTPSATTSSSSISMRIQKKVLGKMAKRGVVKHFMSNSADRLFDNLFIVLKDFRNKEIAEKVLKNLLKISIKLAYMSRENKLSMDQEKQLRVFMKKLRNLVLTITSFSKVAYSYDRKFLLEQLDDTQTSIELIVKATLSEKSMKRVEHVFKHFGDPAMLDQLFYVRGPYAKNLEEITDDLEKLLENQDL